MDKQALRSLFGMKKFDLFQKFLEKNKLSYVKGVCPLEYVQMFILNCLDESERVEVLNKCVQYYPQVLGFGKE